MTHKKFIIIIYGIMFSLLGCSKIEKEEVIPANQVYMEIYNEVGTIQALDEVQNVIEAFGKNGLEFEEKISNCRYYIVYSWGQSNSLFEELDIRGH